jgi:hypothetical protein
MAASDSAMAHFGQTEIPSAHIIFNFSPGRASNTQTFYPNFNKTFSINIVTGRQNTKAQPA